SFLAADAVLRICLKIIRGLTVNETVIAAHVRNALPYLVTEEILMRAAAAGGDRQDLHERIRQHSHAATANLKSGASSNDLIQRLRGDPAFRKVNFDRILDPKSLIGRAPEQVNEFIESEVKTLPRQYHSARK